MMFEVYSNLNLHALLSRGAGVEQLANILLDAARELTASPEHDENTGTPNSTATREFEARTGTCYIVVVILRMMTRSTW